MQERYEEGYGTVLDSGTTFTYLPSEAFQLFKEAVSAYALEHGLNSVKGPDPKVSMFAAFQSQLIPELALNLGTASGPAEGLCGAGPRQRSVASSELSDL